jgi:hypothetical protein
MRRFQAPLLALAVVVRGFGLVSAAGADSRCSNWVSWEYGAGYSVAVRSCINHSTSNVTSNVCVDGLVPNTAYRCISETAFGVQWSLTHPL